MTKKEDCRVWEEKRKEHISEYLSNSQLDNFFHLMLVSVDVSQSYKYDEHCHNLSGLKQWKFILMLEIQ